MKRHVSDLCRRARIASGNAKYALHRLPKGHWMRTDQAKSVRKFRTDKFGKVASGIR